MSCCALWYPADPTSRKVGGVYAGVARAPVDPGQTIVAEEWLSPVHGYLSDPGIGTLPCIPWTSLSFSSDKGFPLLSAPIANTGVEADAAVCIRIHWVYTAAVGSKQLLDRGVLDLLQALDSNTLHRFVRSRNIIIEGWENAWLTLILLFQITL